jgi:hypothetical protein
MSTNKTCNHPNLLSMGVKLGTCIDRWAWIEDNQEQGTHKNIWTKAEWETKRLETTAS